MQLKQNICGVDIEFHQAPFHKTNTAISFKQGSIEIMLENVDTNKDYVPLFTALHARETYAYRDIVFSWPIETTMQVAQGDYKINLENITYKPPGHEMSFYEMFCFIAMLRCIDPY
jgi:hypothetical protein